MTSSAAKKARIKPDQQEPKVKPSGLWIDSERLPTRLAQKGREELSRAMTRLAGEYGDTDNHCLKLAEMLSMDEQAEDAFQS